MNVVLKRGEGKLTRFSMFFVVWVLVLFSLIYFAVASDFRGVDLDIVSPSGTQANISKNFTFNVTFGLATPSSNATPLNVTFNISLATNALGAIAQFTFTAPNWSSLAGVTGTAANQTSFNVTVNTSTLPDGNYTLNITATNFTTPDMSTFRANSSDVIYFVIDNTPPNVSVFNSPSVTHLNVSPLNGSLLNPIGLAGNFTINVSVNDSNLGGVVMLGNVMINISDVNGTFIRNFSLNETVYRIAGTALFNVSWNLSAEADSNYTLTIVANDSQNNTNATVKVNVTIDRRAPAVLDLATSVSGSGSSATVKIVSTTQERANMSIVYGPSQTQLDTSVRNSTRVSGLHGDIITGLAAATYFFNLTACDYSHNCNTTGPENFTVPSSADGTGGGGGSAAAVVVAATTVKDTVLATVGSSAQYEFKGQGSKVEFTALPDSVGSHSVKVESWNAGKGEATITVASTPQTLTVKVGEEKKFDLNSNGYYDLKVRLDSVTSAAAKFTFTVLDGKEAVPGTTSTTSTTGGTTPTGAGETTTPPAGEGTGEKTSPPAEEPAGVEEGGALGVGVIAGLVIVLLVIVGLIFFLATRKSK